MTRIDWSAAFALGLTAGALSIAQPAGAQGVVLYGDARLGLGYNIDNDGGATGEDDLRAVSRVRFGVNMTGESDSGIVYGAEIRADNAEGGEGGEIGQFEGSVFVSGSWGTLTFGDTDGADALWVGDLNEVGLTCLGCENETPFISNGGGFGNDELVFADNPEARPTIRYDFDIAGFGFSVSSNRDLTDIGVGAGWTGEVGAATLSVGAGYYDYAAFFAVGEPETVTFLDSTGNLVVFEALPVEAEVSAGEQWSAALGGEVGAFNGKVIYTTADSHQGSSFELLGAGLGAEFGPWQLNGYYFAALDADRPPRRFRRQRQHGRRRELRSRRRRIAQGGRGADLRRRERRRHGLRAQLLTVAFPSPGGPAKVARHPPSDPLRTHRMPLADIQSRIAAAVARAGRPVDAVTLVAISKVQPLDRIEAVLASGQRVFGENRVQEAEGRWPDLRASYPGVELHLVGPLQSNKLARALELFDAIHSLDRDSLARKLGQAVQARGACPTLFVQVNTGREPQKAGVDPDALDTLLAACRSSYDLPVFGLMAIPPADADPVPHFELLRTLAGRHALAGLSMGMSGDFEQAIACGATHVRVGSAIFGERTPLT